MAVSWLQAGEGEDPPAAQVRKLCGLRSAKRKEGRSARKEEALRETRGNCSRRSQALWGQRSGISPENRTWTPGWWRVSRWRGLGPVQGKTKETPDWVIWGRLCPPPQQIVLPKVCNCPAQVP